MLTDGAHPVKELVQVYVLSLGPEALVSPGLCQRCIIRLISQVGEKWYSDLHFFNYE